MTVRIMVTGSRKWTDSARIEQALAWAWKVAGGGDDVVLIHGAAVGADTIASNIWERQGWKTEAWPADWEKDGKRAAGPRRNQRMIDSQPRVVLAFHKDDSPGTRDAIRRAKTAGITVVLWSEEKGVAQKSTIIKSRTAELVPA